MLRTLMRMSMVLACLGGAAVPAVAQELSAHEREELDAWFRRAA